MKKAIVSYPRVTPGSLWIPPHDVLWSIQQERRDRLERDYRFIYDQLIGVRPTGDWLEILIREIARWAAPAVVQTGTRGSKTGGSGNIVASISGVTPGNLLIGGVALNEFTTSTSALAASGWTGILGNPPSGSQTYRPQAEGFQQVAAGTSATLTIPTLGTDSYGYVTIIEVSGVSGVDTGATLGSNNANGTATTSTYTSPNPTAVADTLMLSIGTAEVGGGGTSNYSTPASFNGSTTGVTSIGNNPNDSAVIAYDFSRKLLSATATPAATNTWTGASRYNGGIIALSGSGGGATFGRLVGGTLCGGSLTNGLLSGWM